MTATSPGALLREAEEALLNPDVHGQRDLVDALLHPDFIEIGRSGTRWTRAETLDALAADPGTRVTTDEWHADDLGSGLWLLTYRVTDGEGMSRHSSLWQLGGELPRLRFHPGTRVSGH